MDKTFNFYEEEVPEWVINMLKTKSEQKVKYSKDFSSLGSYYGICSGYDIHKGFCINGNFCKPGEIEPIEPYIPKEGELVFIKDSVAKGGYIIGTVVTASFFPEVWYKFGNGKENGSGKFSTNAINVLPFDAKLIGEKIF